MQWMTATCKVGSKARCLLICWSQSDGLEPSLADCMLDSCLVNGCSFFKLFKLQLCDAGLESLLEEGVDGEGEEGADEDVEFVVATGEDGEVTVQDMKVGAIQNDSCC